MEFHKEKRWYHGNLSSIAPNKSSLRNKWYTRKLWLVLFLGWTNQILSLSQKIWATYDEEDLYYTYIIVSLSYLSDITSMLYWIHENVQGFCGSSFLWCVKAPSQYLATTKILSVQSINGPKTNLSRGRPATNQLCIHLHL